MAADTLEWSAHPDDFGEAALIDGDLPGQYGHGQAGSTRSESWYWGFHEPKTRLHGFLYIEMRPRLGAATGGVWVKRGSKPHAIASEIYDMRSNMSADIFDSGRSIRLENGFQARFLDPMKTQALSYWDDAASSGFELAATAVTPALMRSGNAGFEQVMRMQGKVVIDGKTIPIECLAVRDRSRRDARSEAPRKVPPCTWLNAIFSEDFMIQVYGHDDPARNPEWTGIYDLPPDQIIKDAYVYRDGRTKRFTRLSKITTRDPVSLNPVLTVIDATDSDGQHYHLVGDVIATAPWAPWHNCCRHIGTTRWTCDRFAGVGYGETHETHWHHYVSQSQPDTQVL